MMEQLQNGNWIIRRALIYDGLGSKPVRRDLIVSKGKISGITSSADSVTGYNEINASSYILTPGFIDVHRHCDIQPMYSEEFGIIELKQGITSVIAGNCGLSSVPASSDTIVRDAFDTLIRPCLGESVSSYGYNSYQEYFNALHKARKRVNFGMLAAMGAIRASVKGYDETHLSEEDFKKIRYYLDEAFSCGCLGVSFGVMYSPECNTTEDEYVKTASIVAEHNGIISCHIRGEGDSLVPSIKEMLNVAGKSGCRMQISHFKAVGRKNWKKNIYEAAGLIEDARRSGVDVTVDFYPYDCGSSSILTLIPPNCIKKNIDETLAYLDSAEGRGVFKSSINKKFPGWDNMVESIGWDRIVICSPILKPDQIGYDLKTVACLNGYDDPADYFIDICLADKGRCGVVLKSMDMDDVRFVCGLEYSMVISDALYGCGEIPHPRLYGAFPEFISFAVGEGILTLEDAIRKMTSFPADRFNLFKRGRVEVGCVADLNLIDLNSFKSNSKYEDPCHMADGVIYSFVNGCPVIFKGSVVDTYDGKIIYSGR